MYYSLLLEVRVWSFAVFSFDQQYLEDQHLCGLDTLSERRLYAE